MTITVNKQNSDLSALNQHFAALNAEGRVAYALDNLPGIHVLSSSFGAQAAVMLHLLTQQKPDIPVILIDTGYLFPETYRFVDELIMRLDLNLKVYRSTIAPAWQEARHGKLWQQGVDGIDKYNRINKVEPMRAALQDLKAGTWFAGLRRNQAHSRNAINFVSQQQQRYKVHPIADWTDRDIGRYLKQHDLPYHPLWEQGYVSIGDIHTTQKQQQGMTQEDTRFFGLKRECGLHTDV